MCPEQFRLTKDKSPNRRSFDIKDDLPNREGNHLVMISDVLGWLRLSCLWLLFPEEEKGREVFPSGVV